MAYSIEEARALSQSANTQQAQVAKREAPELVKSGMFSRAIDLLMRPNYASAGVAKALVKGENVWDEFWKGMKGQDKETYSDVLGEMGWNPTTKTGKIARGIAGFIGDVALDPTTYMGGFGLTKLGRAKKAGQVFTKSKKAMLPAEKAAIATRDLLSAKMGGKAVGGKAVVDLAPTLAKQAAAGERGLVSLFGKTIVKGEPVLKGISKAGEWLEQFASIQRLGAGAKGGGLNIKWIKPHGWSDDAWATVKKAAQRGRNKAAIRAKEARAAGIKLIDMEKKWLKEGIKKEEIQNVFMKLSNPKIELIEKLEPVYKDMVSIRDLSNRVIKWAGDSLVKGFDITHVPTEEYFKMFPVDDITGSFGKKFATPKAYSRTWYKLPNDNIINLTEGTIFKGGKVLKILSQDEIKRVIARGVKVANPVEINAGVGVNLFSESLGTIAATMINRIGKVEEGMEFASMMRRFGRMAEDVPKTGAWKPTALKTLVDAKGEPLMFQREIANHLNQVFEKYHNPELTEVFLKNFKKMQNGWKGLVTYMNIPFHARNAVSNVWQNHLAGVSPLSKAYWTSGAIKAKIGLGKKLVGKEAEYMTDFINNGLAGVGWFGADIEKALAKKDNFFFGWGKAIGETIEDHAKLAHFIDMRKKGMSAEAAADSVRKYLFDYADISDFERQAMKTLMPFYTWSRKNIPLQVEKLITQPEKIARLGKIKAEIEGQFDKSVKPPEMLIPKWMKDKLPVYMGGNQKVAKYSMLGGYVPSADLGNALTPLKTALNLVSPFIKVPLELDSNYSFFFQNEISKYEGHREKFLGINLPTQWKYVLGQIRPLNEIHKVFKLRYNPMQENYEQKIGQGLQEYITSFKTYENSIKYMKQNFAGKGWKPATIYQKIKVDHNKAKKSGDKKESLRLKRLLDKHDEMMKVQIGE